MTDEELLRIRREPPPYRAAVVGRVEPLTPRMARVTFVGEALEGLTVEAPAASVRLLIPSPGQNDLVIPDWTGNEFLLPDGSRPAIRTFTPRRSEGTEVDLDIVIAHDGVAANWARAVRAGDPAAISGPGRGYEIDADATAFVLAGDETALPAMSQILERLEGGDVQVLAEVGDRDGILPLPNGHRARWISASPGEPPGTALADAVTALELDPGMRLWAAGEAAAMHRIRRRVFRDLGLPRSAATIRGYWKHGRAATT